MTKLSDLYELHIHGNDYHTQTFASVNYVNSFTRDQFGKHNIINFYDPFSELPSSSSIYDRYISSTTANGGTENYIYEGSGSEGLETQPEKGSTAFLKELEQYYVFNGTSGIESDTFIDHNLLSGLQGGTTDEYYHLDSIEYGYLDGQDQALKTTSSPTFNDITITNPNSVYNLSHNNFSDYLTTEHRQGENSITQNIHDNNITSSSITQHESNITHNNLTGLQGGTTNEYYHLDSIEYGYLDGQDQALKTTSSPTFQYVTMNGTSPNNNQAVRKDYVDSLVQEGLQGIRSIIDFYDPSGGLPTNPTDGDRYISSATGNGWTENYIYEGEEDESSGLEVESFNGYTALIEIPDKLFTYRENDNQGVKLSSFFNHNALSSLQGGVNEEYYHLSQSVYTNLTSSNVSFNDITITNPNSVYNLSHNNFSDYVADQHIDWTITGTQTIHDDRITQSSIIQYETFINHNSLTNYISSEHRQGENSITQNIHDNNITSSSITQHESNITHNNLTGLQGGTTNEYYHLSLNDHNKIPNGDSAYSETSSSTSSNTPNTLMKRDSDGDVQCRLFRSSYSSKNSDIAGIYTTRVIGGDYMRPSTPTQVENALPSKSNGDSAYSHSNSTDEHIDGSVTGTKKIHENRIVQSSTTQRGTIVLATDEETSKMNNSTKAVTPSNLHCLLGGQVAYGIKWDTTNSDPSNSITPGIIQNGIFIEYNYLSFPIQQKLGRGLLKNNGDGTPLHPNESGYYMDGTLADLSGEDGQVMVQVPSFYQVITTDGTDKYFLISEKPFIFKGINSGKPLGFRDKDEVYIGAFEGSLYDVSTNELKTFLSGSADTSEDLLYSVNGTKPGTDQTRNDYRLLARNTGDIFHQFDWGLLEIIYILYITEYKNWNTQQTLPGYTETDTGDYAYTRYSGRTTELGNNSGSILCDLIGDDSDLDGVISENDYIAMSYRGIENVFGHIGKFVDGINIDNINGNGRVYVNYNVSTFEDNTGGGDYIDTKFEPNFGDSNGYIIDIKGEGKYCSFYPSEIGGSSSTYLCDYNGNNAGAGRVVDFGGSLRRGTYAGFFCLHLHYWSSYHSNNFGSRLAACVT